MISKGKIQAVVGGQFGSESKGAVAGWLARRAYERDEPIIAVRVAGPNAGHTAYDDQGRRWALRQIPVMAVTNPDAMLIIAAGSEIDPDVLQHEIDTLEDAGIPVQDRLYVDQSATIITDDHKEREAMRSLVEKIGSTAKGIGAARADRIMRDAELWGGGEDTLPRMYEALDRGVTLILEGTQGYGLGLHGEHYPQCTSSDCRAQDFLSMAGLPAWRWEVEPWVVLRTHPIRVAGNSGELKNETTWEQIGQEPEKTTVTQKVRRVGEWDPELAREAVWANGGPEGNVRVALGFWDYWYPEMEGETQWSAMTDEMIRRLIGLEKEVGAPIRYVGTSPTTAIAVPTVKNQRSLA